MNLLVAIEGHFFVGDTGAIYGDGPARYSAWANYLEVFDQVTVLARIAQSQRVWPEEARADGPCVSFCALPDYRGPWQFLRMLPELKARVCQAVAQCDAFILRVPGLVGRVAWREITRLGKPYAVEVVGDPWDALGPGTWPSLFRPLFRRAGVRDLKSMCQGAMAAHYVTQKALQQRYPPGKDTYAVGFSDALMDSAFASPQDMEKRLQRIEARATQGTGHASPFRIGFIGSMAQMYKGPDLLLRAAALCRSRGLNLETILAGDGRYKSVMIGLAAKLGIADATEFAGQLPFGKAVVELLDSIDLFVLPSRAEGLPRALLEAMARGCPCVGSDAGGIPELLAADDIFPTGNYRALAEKVMEVAGNPLRLRQMAMRNFEVSRGFSPERLKGARQGFLRHVKIFSKAKEPAEGANATLRGDATVREHFDSHTDIYVDKYEEPYKAVCRERIGLLKDSLGSPSRKPLAILDVGCGAGLFIDMLLTEFPEAQAFGVDSSIAMLRRNTRVSQKHFVLGDARELPFRPKSFDLINVDTVMHHLVDFRGYQYTIGAVEHFLLSLQELLKPGGLLIVREIYHESFLRDSLGARLVYELSTFQLPGVLAGLLKRLGLTTANAGVCFLTRRQWDDVFQRTHYTAHSVSDKPWINHGLGRIVFPRNGDLFYTLSPTDSH